MKKAFEQIKLSDERKAEVLEELLIINREKNGKEMVNMNKEGDIMTEGKTTVHELKPKKRSGIRTAGIIAAAALVAVAVGTAIFVGTSVIRERGNDRAAGQPSQQKDNAVYDPDGESCIFFVNDISYNEEKDIVLIKAYKIDEYISGALAEEQKTDEPETADGYVHETGYVISVYTGDFVMGDGDVADVKELMKRCKNDTLIIEVWYTLIKETYPAQIDASRVKVTYEGEDLQYEERTSDADAELSEYADYELGILLRYDADKFEIDNNSQEQGMVTLRAKDWNRASMSVYKSEYNYEDTIEGLKRQADTEDIEERELKGSDEQEGDSCTYLAMAKESGSETLYMQYYVVDIGDGSGSVYIAEIISRTDEKGNVVLEDEWNSILENMELMEKSICSYPKAE